MNENHEREAMSVLSQYVVKTPTNALNSRMSAQDRLSSFATSVRNEEPRTQELLRFCLEVVNYLFKKYATDRATAKNDAAILRYAPSPKLSPQQYVDKLIAKSCKVADIYDEGTLNDVLIEGVDASSGIDHPTTGKQTHRPT